MTKPFERLRSKDRAMYILHMALFTNKEISRLLHTSERTVTRVIKKGNEEYVIMSGEVST